ncbi:hypothetical protein, partial [Shewanella putrefaciens]|uniref:hypothetical protein n=1 Tax=Shewanella putrefaciens TaxID=24 RepID=UPI00356B5BFF
RPRAGDLEQVLDYVVDPNRQQRQIAKGHAGLLVHAPIEDGQSKEIELCIAQEGESPKNGIQKSIQACTP